MSEKQKKVKPEYPEYMGLEVEEDHLQFYKDDATRRALEDKKESK